MSKGVVVNFMAHLNKKFQAEILKDRLIESGWTIDSDISAVDSEVCIYLIDSKEDGILLFGCKKNDFPEPGSDKIIHWGHFVLAWDVIADPSMSFDEIHKNNTKQFALRALPGLPEWPSFSVKALFTKEMQKAHILVIIDRKNMDSPFELIVAHSELPVMYSETIQSIVKSYTKTMPNGNER